MPDEKLETFQERARRFTTNLMNCRCARCHRQCDLCRDGWHATKEEPNNHYVMGRSGYMHPMKKHKRVELF